MIARGVEILSYYLDSDGRQTFEGLMRPIHARKLMSGMERD